MSSRESLRAFRPKVHQFEYEGQTFHVRAMSGAGRAKYLELCRASHDGSSPPMSKVVALGLCEPDGALAYNIDNDADIKEIDEIDGAVLQAIVFKLYEVSGLTAKSVEDASKNS